jgi:hypothetical protein
MEHMLSPKSSSGTFSKHPLPKRMGSTSLISDGNLFSPRAEIIDIAAEDYKTENGNQSQISSI